jgi:hypothetical protein
LQQNSIEGPLPEIKGFLSGCTNLPGGFEAKVAALQRTVPAIPGELEKYIDIEGVERRLRNWRKTISCPHCGLTNRWRACIHLLEAITETAVHDRVYLTERLPPRFHELATRQLFRLNSVTSRHIAQRVAAGIR